ncbi:hypothetical protein [Mycolicibacterium stellerae]|uniref:hypothetical protein n=1 Tax=Mycolicibacterium stellerae TaxID=2358193 RepID=UPI000F0B61A3|nr:hypothetical protein [Mycolicibacterium stellerae]
MAHSTVRFAAGAGVVASLLIGGPNPAQAQADGHALGPYANDDYQNIGSSGQSNGLKRPVSNWVNDVPSVLGIGDKDPKPNLDPPPMDLGTGGSVLEDVPTVSSFSAEEPIAMRSAAVVAAPAGDNVAAAAPRSGGGYSGRPVTSFQAPRVTIGNGRTPGTHVRRPGPAPSAVLLHDTLVSPAAAPPAPAAIEINIPPLPPPLPPVEFIGPAEMVTGQLGTSTTDTVTDPLAGLAGLILLPAIGAVLGFRQARAAQSLRDSLRT